MGQKCCQRRSLSACLLTRSPQNAWSACFVRGCLPACLPGGWEPCPAWANGVNQELLPVPVLLSCKNKNTRKGRRERRAGREGVGIRRAEGKACRSSARMEMREKGRPACHVCLSACCPCPCPCPALFFFFFPLFFFFYLDYSHCSLFLCLLQVEVHKEEGTKSAPPCPTHPNSQKYRKKCGVSTWEGMTRHNKCKQIS